MHHLLAGTPHGLVALVASGDGAEIQEKKDCEILAWSDEGVYYTVTDDIGLWYIKRKLSDFGNSLVPYEVLLERVSK